MFCRLCCRCLRYNSRFIHRSCNDRRDNSRISCVDSNLTVFKLEEIFLNFFSALVAEHRFQKFGLNSVVNFIPWESEFTVYTFDEVPFTESYSACFVYTFCSRTLCVVGTGLFTFWASIFHFHVLRVHIVFGGCCAANILNESYFGVGCCLERPIIVEDVGSDGGQTFSKFMAY